MEFIADLHIHSRFSRATAKNLDLENIYIAAQLKGITVVGTGDCTHPGWFSEIKEKLVPAEEGLFKLRKEIAEKCDREVPASCRGDVRFILVSEISNIYKKDHKTRKNHNIVFLPDLVRAEKFNLKLDKIGNIKSDGRPILGLDTRDLLEILLETSDQAFLIPAHIWTPWFSLLGSKSGFDSIEECFEDLTPHIFAVETGLSSDPEMNWRVSSLDGLTLISNSDAHSPLKLGREANLFNTQLSYPAIRSAIQTGDPEQFIGTLEFYPQEGKYHLDGHRKCNIRYWPEETRSLSGKCPVCEKPLTLGVLYRVEELADRPQGVKPAKHHKFYNIIPLTEILAEILQVGPGTKRVMKNYRTLLEKLGPELEILNRTNPENLARAGAPLLGEAIARMRRNEIVVLPGYDGEFGKIKIFNQDEREKLLDQKKLFVIPATNSAIKKKHKAARGRPEPKTIQTKTTLKQPTIFAPSKLKDEIDRFDLDQLNPEQRRAVEHPGGPLMIIAGPGTGKTHTLTHRLAHLIISKRVLPHNILAVTFTNKAAQEMRSRLELIMGSSPKPPFVGTFHGLCYKLLSDHLKTKHTIINPEDRHFIISEAIRSVEHTGLEVSAPLPKMLGRIISAKQLLLEPDDIGGDDGLDNKVFAAVYKSYQTLLSIEGLYDYEDLVLKTVRLFQGDPFFTKQHRDLYKYVFVDEYQDLNYGQHCLVRALAPPGRAGHNLCVIGDPQQSIYGFRGSDSKYFKRFIDDYPDTEVINLSRNYRSTQTILDASYQAVSPAGEKDSAGRVYSEIDGTPTVSVLETVSDKAEAVAVGRTIERLIGGTGFHSIDFGRVGGQNPRVQRSFSDFAVLFRTADQGGVFGRVFDDGGIPYQVVSRQNFFNTKGVSEMISFLKIIEDSGCYADLVRIMRLTKPGIGKPSLEIFKQWCYQKNFTVARALANARRFPIKGMRRAQQTKLNNFVEGLENIKQQAKGLGLADKLILIAAKTRLAEVFNNDPETKEAFNQLIDISRTSSHNTSEFFMNTALQSDTDTHAPRAEKVALMTMHAAKGLEFPVVFVVGCEKGYLPFQRPANDATDIDEERRLFYVAMTRAQERLYLTYAKKRRIYGKTEKRTISPFVGAIEERLKTLEKTIPGRQKPKGPAQLKLF